MKELAVQTKSDSREKPALNVGSISQGTPSLDTKKQVQEEALLSASHRTSSFSAVLIRHHDQKQLTERRMHLGLWCQRDTCSLCQGSMAAHGRRGTKNRKLRAHCSTIIMKQKEPNLKALPLWWTSSSKAAPPKPSPTEVPPAED